MKKSVLFLLTLLLLISCGENKSSVENQDSSNLTESLDKTENTIDITQQAKQDSILQATEQQKQDSIAKAKETDKAAAKYDKIINEYVSTVNSFYKVSANVHKSGNWEKGVTLLQKCHKQESKINKIKSNLTPEQLNKFKKANAKYNKANAPGRYAG